MHFKLNENSVIQILNKEITSEESINLKPEPSNSPTNKLSKLSEKKYECLEEEKLDKNNKSIDNLVVEDDI